MSGTIRSRMEAQQERHSPANTAYGRDVPNHCEHCRLPWPCPDRVAADDTLTDLNNAEIRTEVNRKWPEYERQYRLIPDPDSRGAA